MLLESRIDELQGSLQEGEFGALIRSVDGRMAYIREPKECHALALRESRAS